MSNERKGPTGAPALTGDGRAAANPSSKSTPRPNKHDELRLLVNSRHPIITVETPEEERFEQLLCDVAMELTGARKINPDRVQLWQIPTRGYLSNFPHRMSRSK